LAVQGQHRQATAPQIVEAVGRLHDYHLGVAHLTLQAGSVLDQLVP
jgi:hypothetical protein